MEEKYQITISLRGKSKQFAFNTTMTGNSITDATIECERQLEYVTNKMLDADIAGREIVRTLQCNFLLSVASARAFHSIEEAKGKAKES